MELRPPGYIVDLRRRLDLAVLVLPADAGADDEAGWVSTTARRLWRLERAASVRWLPADGVAVAGGDGREPLAAPLAELAAFRRSLAGLGGWAR